LRVKDKVALGFEASGERLRAGLLRLGASLQPKRSYKPAQIVVAPQDMRIGDPTVARGIIEGQMLFAGRFADTGGRSPFDIAPPSTDFLRELAGFGWLRHFRDLPRETGPAATRKLIGDFVSKKRMLASPAFEPAVAARRLISSISHSPLVLVGASPEFHAIFLGLIGADCAILRRAEAVAGPQDRLQIATGLLYAALGCKGLETLIDPATAALTNALAASLLEDGAHRSRNPAATIDIGFDLLPLKQAYGLREKPAPKAIAAYLSRMTGMLRTLSHRDGRLVTFNGAGPVVAADLAVLHSYERSEREGAVSTGSSRYLRLDAGRTTLFMDGGAPPARAWSAAHHAAPLAFEFSHHDTRIVVSCGSPPPGLPDLAALARQTAAHSTVSVGQSDAAEFIGGLDGPILAGARKVELTRLSSEGWTLIDSNHDGYRSRFGLVHRRKIALSADGEVIAGEDRLESVKKGRIKPAEAVIRFHLGPDVRGQLSRSGQGVALDAGVAGLWLFSAENVQIDLEESVIFATFRGRQRTSQIVLPMPQDNAPVIWRFTRMRESG
jgi:uncharacterized heparinase superfamily protein